MTICQTRWLASLGHGPPIKHTNVIPIPEEHFEKEIHIQSRVGDTSMPVGCILSTSWSLRFRSLLALLRHRMRGTISLFAQIPCSLPIQKALAQNMERAPILRAAQIRLLVISCCESSWKTFGQKKGRVLFWNRSCRCTTPHNESGCEFSGPFFFPLSLSLSESNTDASLLITSNNILYHRPDYIYIGLEDRRS